LLLPLPEATEAYSSQSRRRALQCAPMTGVRSNAEQFAIRCSQQPTLRNMGDRRADVVMRRRCQGRAALPTARVQHATLEDLTDRRILPDSRTPFRSRNYLSVYGRPDTSQGESASFDRKIDCRSSRRSRLAREQRGRSRSPTQRPQRRLHFLTLSSHCVYVQLIVIVRIFLLWCPRKDLFYNLLRRATY